MATDTSDAQLPPEPLSRCGEVLLSHNHIALLHGLLDRPNATAVSTADWQRAAFPYLRHFRSRPVLSSLAGAVATMHPSWVSSRRVAQRQQWTLAERGRAILEGEVPARIRGHGPYSGLRPFVARRTPAPFDPHEWADKGFEAIEAWYARLKQERMHRGVVELIEAILEHWAHESHGDWYLGPKRQVLRQWLLHFVMSKRVFPGGTHMVSVPGEDISFEVDFDALGL